MEKLTMIRALTRRSFVCLLFLLLFVSLSMMLSLVSAFVRQQRPACRSVGKILSPPAAAIGRRQRRLLGSKADVPGNPSGKIDIYNEQNVMAVDETQLTNTLTAIRKLIGYDTYDVTLILVDDDEMKSQNLESRGIPEPTDILSFPFHAAVTPGVLENVQFDIPDYYMLGDLIVDVPYVIRRCEEDKAALKEDHNDEDDDSGEEEEEERGVSGAMATVFDPTLRINMLLVHGMLHLVGHDHEEDDEYELMVTKEEEILRQLGMPLPK